MELAELHALNADLHCHSTVSDGWLEPADVVRRAKANGVELLALTDHDELGGLAVAAATASELGLRFIPGVEVSVSFADETIHIVGLGIDPQNSGIVAGLRQIRSGRDARAVRIGEALAAAGIGGALEGARRFARNPALVSRAHFARHLVASGVMPDVRTVFDHYLVRGKPGFVEHEWASLEDAVGWIVGAGGIAVVAHPARYRLSNADMGRLLDRFVAAGGEAIEVVSGAHSEDEMRRFATVARQRGLLASRASDFHGEKESPVDVGRCNPLPPDLTPVWSRFI
ncbi:3',5'-nucleoside bisphosphate phosphatase [Thauera linaloolentis]|uniref:Metal-dependent phosphoesterase n=1 Tax=Thauera linaloolentis (strain DSM 12138 / JCM 21573 / CCUG 41526 / CIP 105981 / IAM 15112 / NBRC 102519 / 47Lol) TaxID=1123367 RepID=N6ZEB3_THAL4|nr:3',5'-nucleoside bisphosphate phosphatase [Thauera linaloolentis]ENO90514.1 metal-dependent phosphoesterase [Thauera linaloolentis 47Lol = DSM 12138]MCM8566373.1 PHP domain-containing protein [Thauera linaloolentis]